MYIVREVLHTTSGTVLYRGRREQDGAAVVIKALGPQHRPQHLERLRNEYAILTAMDVPQAVRPIALESYQGMPALVLEDFGGESLQEQGTDALEIRRFLRLAIKIAAATAAIHGQNVVHKDLKPENILVQPTSGEVKIADFGIAALLPCQRPAIGSAPLLEGSLPYMSPEQTGRTNRALDPRSDLYSLGVVFYQLLTGRLPFQAVDPLEWVHCHVARTATAPAELLASVPGVLSDLVMKLLAKEPDERYQSARGLQHDLETCLSRWEVQGKIAGFALGQRDVRERLQIPHKLYGRDQELAALLSAFQHVVAGGPPELVLISGYAGIGKSSLVHELQKPIVRQRGFFATGKFDQFKRDIPYSTIVEAFTELVLEILAGSEEQIAVWRERLQTALGKSAQLVVDVIPPIELVIGPQPPVPELPPAEAQNRFRLVFRHFIAVFAAPEHPLALFLDDLQWADSASLALLQDLVTQPEAHHLFVVGAFRDNEVTDAHPLLPVLAAVQQAGARVTNITLGPLPYPQLGAFLGDILHGSDQQLTDLADLVQEKTGGNPFFTIQFLGILEDDGLIEFDTDLGGFRWDVARIRSKQFTDNVVDLMVGKLRRLPEPAQTALQQLACLGGTADIATLAMATGASEASTHEDLAQAVRGGLILRLNDSYRFLHDRVQEAAYSLIPVTVRPHLHLQIGRLLLARLPPASLDERVFDIVNQMNRGLALITEALERDTLRRLNCNAGKRAKASVAYQSACGYLEQAAALLPANAWSTRHEETFDLTLERAECEYLGGNFLGADDLFNLLLDRADSDLARTRVYILRTRLYQVSGRFADGLKVALEALRLFDVVFPESDQDLARRFLSESREISGNLRGRRIADLVDAPALTDPTVKAIMGLLVDAMPCAYIARSQFFPLLAVRALNFSLHYGNSAESCLAYSAYSIMLVSIFGDIAAATEFSQMSLRLNVKLDDAKLKGTLLFLHGGFVNCWGPHLATSRPIMDQALLASLEVGDLVYAGYNACQSIWHAFERGDALDDVLHLSEQHAAAARQSHNDTVLMVVRQYRQYIAALKGLTRAPTTLADDTFAEDECLTAFARAGFFPGICFQHVIKQILGVTFEDPDLAMAAASRATPLLGAVMGSVHEASHLFYEALTLAALYPSASADRQAELRDLLTTRQKKLAFWADNSPENHTTHHALVAAEIARIENGELEATVRLYEKAIRAAADSGFVHKEALANELAGRFFLGRGLDRIAETYLREARICYLRWGADAKVEKLDLQYPRLRERRALVPTPTFTRGAEHADMVSVVKASQGILSEMGLDALMAKLIRVVIEQAGAQQGHLILRRSIGLVIEAEAQVASGGVIVVRLLHAQPVAGSSLLPASIVNYVWRTKQKVLLENAAGSSRFAADDYVTRTQARSVLCLPLLSSGPSEGSAPDSSRAGTAADGTPVAASARPAEGPPLLGLLYLENNLVAGAFTGKQLELLDLLAQQAAISLENAQFLSRERAGRAAAESSERRKTFLAEASAILSESLDYERVLHEVAGLCVRALADWCVVDLIVDGEIKRLVGRHRDPLKQPLIEAVQRRYPPQPQSPQPAAKVMRTGIGVLLPEPTPAELRARCVDLEHFKLAVAVGVRDALCVPLTVRGQTIGALTLGAAGAIQYDETDLELAQELASRSALAIENARLHRETIEALRLREDFLSVASHELYTPLASLNLVLETLAPTTTTRVPLAPLDPEVLQKSVDLARRQGGRLARLIGELLDVSRLSSGRLPLDLAQVDLTSLTSEVLQRFALDFARARCTASFEGGHPVLGRWDRSRLDQVIANLLSNAIKFGPGQPIEVAVMERQGVACIRVKDNGIGVALLEQAKIFDRFRRGVSSANYGGLGLGLYICRGLVEAHAGTISVQSSGPGAGAAFTVELPCRGPD